MICIAFMAKVTAVHIVAIEQITFALWHFKISCSTVYPSTKTQRYANRWLGYNKIVKDHLSLF